MSADDDNTRRWRDRVWEPRPAPDEVQRLASAHSTELTKQLGDFRAVENGESFPDELTVARVNYAIPTPQAVSMMLRSLGLVGSVHAGDKEAWRLAFRVGDVYCVLVHSKFGLKLAVDAALEDQAEEFISDVVSRLTIAIGVFEDLVLKPFGERQVADSRITISNEHHQFWERYQYFRDRAAESFGRKPESPPSLDEPGVFDLLGGSRHGFFYATAMVYAYFSLLEHRLILWLPFTSPRRGWPDVQKFFRGTWTDKFTTIWDTRKDGQSIKILQTLQSIAAEHRNPLAHGGFHRGRGAMFIHGDQAVGALPADYGDRGPWFRWTMLDVEVFNRVCSQLDEVDRWFAEEGAPFGAMWSESGLNVQYDERTREVYLDVMLGGTDVFEAFLEETAEHQDRIDNIDY